MNAPSLKLCKELFDLSGWEGDDRWYMTNISEPDRVIGTATPRIFEHDADYNNGYRTDIPAYELGYILRKLPQKLEIQKRKYSFVLTGSTSDGSWIADYMQSNWNQPLDLEHNPHVWLHWGSKAKLTEANTPQDAACKLAIELLKKRLI